MKKIAFVSDFDGTLTEMDFYHIIINKYLKERGREFYEEWRKSKKINVDFLNKIFGAMDKSEEEIRDEILNIPFDKTAEEFIKRVIKNGWGFYIVSAGTSYYIEILLKHLNIDSVKVISMKGIYENRGIRIIPDKDSVYYSEIFGLDKRRVIEDLKKEFDTVLFAGDSEPDLEAAKAADIVFARGELIKLLERDNIKFIEFKNYKQIDMYLGEKGWFA